MEQTKELYLYGASGHSKVILDIALLNGWRMLSYIDDNILLSEYNNYNVLHDIESINYKENQLVISIGNNILRKKISDKLRTCSPYLLHPNAYISTSVVIGHGTVVMSNVSINASTKVGQHVIINTNSSIDHDCVISDFVHVSPNVALAGNVEIGEGTHIGIGASVIQGVKIGKWSTIGAGSVVIKDIPDFAVVVGNPGKIIKYNTKHEF